MSKQPPSAPTATAVGPCPIVIQIVGRPGTGSLPSTIASPDHPQKSRSESGASTLVQKSGEATGERSRRLDRTEQVELTSRTGGAASIPLQTSDKKDRCPIARCQELVSRMHAATHLPGIFDDQLELSEELLRRRISAQKICKNQLLGSVSDLSSLIDFVNDLRQIPMVNTMCRSRSQGLCP